MHEKTDKVTLDIHVPLQSHIKCSQHVLDGIECSAVYTPRQSNVFNYVLLNVL
jgi:hypothetical protein